MSLSIILFFIFKACNKRNKNNQIYAIKKNAYHFISNTRRKKSISKFKKFLIILLISIIDFISIALEYSVILSYEMFLCSWYVNIFITSFFSYLLLKIKLYNHHYFTIIILTINCILINIFVLLVTRLGIKEYFLIFLYNFIAITLHCLAYVIFKYFIQTTYIRSYEIMFLQGLIELILSIVIIAILMSCKIMNDFQYFYNIIIEEELWKFILSIFIYFGYYSQLFIIIDIFSPFHIILVVSIFIIILALAESEYLYQNFGVYLLISILAFCCFSVFFILIYIEIIEINCCGLSHMTKRNIELRSKIDMALNIDEDDENDDIEIYNGEYNIKLENNIHIGLNSFDSDSSKEK